MIKKYPVCQPYLTGNEKKYLCECIDSGWISSEGPFVRRFEELVSTYTGVSEGVALSSGTAALEAGLYALGVKEGDEVILPSFTIISCAIACLRLGAIPVLVDIDPDTWTLDVNKIEAKITSKTKVLMAVHIYGHPVEMDPVYKLKEKYNFQILEDAAEAHGATYFSEYKGGKWVKAGALGDVAVTSFYANKIITTGEGGMLLTDEKQMADRAREYRNLCFSSDARFYHKDIGYNFRMTNMQAAVGVAQIESIDDLVAAKIRISEYYRDALSNIKGLRFMTVKKWARSVYWMYSVILDKTCGMNAETICARLKKQGVETRPFFTGLHLQPAFIDRGYFHDERFPVTENATEYGFYLPSSLSLKREDVEDIVSILHQEMKA